MWEIPILGIWLVYGPFGLPIDYGHELASCGGKKVFQAGLTRYQTYL